MRTASQRGVGLVGLLVALAIVAILVALTGPERWLRILGVKGVGSMSEEEAARFASTIIAEEDTPLCGAAAVVAACFKPTKKSCSKISEDSLKICIRKLDLPKGPSVEGRNAWYKSVKECSAEEIGKTFGAACQAALKALPRTHGFFVGGVRKVVGAQQKELMTAGGNLASLAYSQKAAKKRGKRFYSMPAIGLGTNLCGFKSPDGNFEFKLPWGQAVAGDGKLCSNTRQKYWCDGNARFFVCHAQGDFHFVVDETEKVRQAK